MNYEPEDEIEDGPEKALREGDILYIKEYCEDFGQLGSSTIINKIYHESITNPFCQSTINYLTTIDIFKRQLVINCITHPNIDRLNYILSITDLCNSYTDITYCIKLYSLRQDFSARKIISIVLDHYKSKIFLDDVLSVIDSYVVYTYLEAECISYVIYKICTLDKLRELNSNNNSNTNNNTNTNNIEALLRYAIRYCAPLHLINLLLEHLPSTSVYHSDSYRDELQQKYNIPTGYVSLFEEDI